MQAKNIPLLNMKIWRKNQRINDKNKKKGKTDWHTKYWKSIWSCVIGFHFCFLSSIFLFSFILIRYFVYVCPIDKINWMKLAFVNFSEILRPLKIVVWWWFFSLDFVFAALVYLMVFLKHHLAVIDALLWKGRPEFFADQQIVTRHFLNHANLNVHIMRTFFFYQIIFSIIFCGGLCAYIVA